MKFARENQEMFPHKRSFCHGESNRHTMFSIYKITILMWVPNRVGSVTISASRGVQIEIVASVGNLGRVGGKFERVGEKFWTSRLELLDASAVNSS